MSTTPVRHAHRNLDHPYEPVRSSAWRRVERAHLAKHPRCACCRPGTNVNAGIQVHHGFPFHYCIALGRPDLELDDRNLISLCETEKDRPSENHHLLVGHLDDFKSSNLDVVKDASVTFFGSSGAEIRGSEAWKTKVLARLRRDALSGALRVPTSATMS